MKTGARHITGRLLPMIRFVAILILEVKFSMVVTKIFSPAWTVKVLWPKMKLGIPIQKIASFEI